MAIYIIMTAIGGVCVGLLAAIFRELVRFREHWEIGDSRQRAYLIETEQQLKELLTAVRYQTDRLTGKDPADEARQALEDAAQM